MQSENHKKSFTRSTRGTFYSCFWRATNARTKSSLVIQDITAFFFCDITTIASIMWNYHTFTCFIYCYKFDRFFNTINVLSWDGNISLLSAVLFRKKKFYKEMFTFGSEMIWKQVELSWANHNRKYHRIEVVPLIWQVRLPLYSTWGVAPSSVVTRATFWYVF